MVMTTKVTTMLIYTLRNSVIVLIKLQKNMKNLETVFVVVVINMLIKAKNPES